MMKTAGALGVFLSVMVSATLLCEPAWAIPQFARATGADCTECHVVAPMLNSRGESFLERGYRLPEHSEREMQSTIPLSMWATGRGQTLPNVDGLRGFLAKVEPISGGAIGDLPLSYFVEWRLVSLDLRDDGTYNDRSGRFEDVILKWSFLEDHDIEVGQFRALEQVDISRRLSISEPSIASSSLPGRSDERARRESVRAFSPSGRSPSVRYGWQSIEGEDSVADGLFHALTLVFPGEFSIPLTSKAAEAASFEFEARPKGLFGETFYRRGLSSIGVHGFVGDARRWLATALGAFHYRDFLVTAGVGGDSGVGDGPRTRISLQNEYLITRFPRLQGAAGFRAEYITGGSPAYIPYLAVAGPNTSYTMLLQAQYRIEEGNNGLFLDLSTMF